MTMSIWRKDPGKILRVGEGFSLRDIDPSSTPGTKADHHEGANELHHSAQRLRELQEKLFAQSWVGKQDSLLVVLQAMDAAGKGGIVNHVFGGVEPYGIELAAFKAPTEEERAHDFLWRVEKRTPGPGKIGLFDRSHYEDVLVQRVRGYASPEEIERRYGAIVDFENELAARGTRILKIMLHISPEEQAERLRSRLDDPDRQWKYTPSDCDDRAFWPDYMEAFQIAIDRTNTESAPWFVVPANNKWYARAAVQRIVIEELERIDPAWPKPDYDPAEEIKRLEASRDLSWP